MGLKTAPQTAQELVDLGENAPEQSFIYLALGLGSSFQL